MTRNLIRAVVALGLLAGLLSEATAASADYTGTHHISVDVVVVGTPPPDTTITVLHEKGNDFIDPTAWVLDLDDVAGSPDIPLFAVTGLSHGIFVDPDETGGADAIDYSCTVQALNGMTNCSKIAGNEPKFFPVVHAFTSFWHKPGGEQSDVTITLTFDPPAMCDGREVTVDLNEPSQTPTAGPDVILGTWTADEINGLGGNDVICGGGGGDTILGGAGRDRVLGGAGSDRLEGGPDGDTLLGLSGADTILGQAGRDALDGGTQRDTCSGGPERDTGVRCEVRTAIP